MTVRILAAGDHFVLNRLFVDALRELGAPADPANPGLPAPGLPAPGLPALDVTELDIAELTLPWPVEPFGPVAEVSEASGSEDELIEALRGAEICLTQMAPLTERVLAACPDLRLFCVSRGGPVNANLEAATAHGVAVTFAPGRNATATAEHTLGMILAAVRRIPSTHGELMSGVWRGDYYTYDSVGPELDGGTVGLVGYGAIGGKVARMLAGFGARVLVFDPYAADDGYAERVSSIEELLSRSTVVSLHARATPETSGMIGAAQLAAMPAGSVLVNCARGSLVDYEAVCDALESGHLFGAAFDVFPEEPLPKDSRLLTAPNVVMTPHLAGASKETAQKAARIVAADVGRHLRGEPLAHCANPEVFRLR